MLYRLMQDSRSTVKFSDIQLQIDISIQRQSGIIKESSKFAQSSLGLNEVAGKLLTRAN